MGSRWARVTRGLLASAVAIFVAALFHVAGGGAAPGPIALALSFAFATLASLLLTARRLSAWRLTVSVVLSQLLFHLLFGIGGGTAAFSVSGGAAGMAHLHAGSHLVMSAAGGASVHADMGALPTTPAMWLSHAMAVLITVIALRFGERAFWGLFETARMGVARIVSHLASTAPAVLAPAASPAAAVESEPSLLRDLGLPLARLRHRGPPAAITAF
ncbi:hypothetical protein [Leifsonia sp. NPDC058230]|uniref:hypothetical protein n=1 Tax=Leifsonia sp. NPDC058230 TaxID=3346391 RepID=UPI0036DFA00F